jgi:hypothetical protein
VESASRTGCIHSMREIFARVIVLALVCFGVWLVGRILLPWLSRDRIVLAVALIFLAAGAGSFFRMAVTRRGFDSSVKNQRELAFNGSFFLLVSITLLLVRHFVFR